MYGDDKLTQLLPRKAWAKGGLEAMRENGRKQAIRHFTWLGRQARIKAEKKRALEAAIKRGER